MPGTTAALHPLLNREDKHSLPTTAQTDIENELTLLFDKAIKPIKDFKAKTLTQQQQETVNYSLAQIQVLTESLANIQASEDKHSLQSSKKEEQNLSIMYERLKDAVIPDQEKSRKRLEDVLEEFKNNVITDVQEKRLTLAKAKNMANSTRELTDILTSDKDEATKRKAIEKFEDNTFSIKVKNLLLIALIGAVVAAATGFLIGLLACGVWIGGALCGSLMLGPGIGSAIYTFFAANRKNFDRINVVTNEARDFTYNQRNVG
jgi:hypothetical protein